MLFYDFKITVVKGLTKEDDVEPVHRRIKSDVTVLNEMQANNVRFFIYDIKGRTISLCGMIGYKNNDDPKALARKFVTDLGFKAVRIEGGETTARQFVNVIRKADMNSYVDDGDAVLQMASLGSMVRGSTTKYFEEYLAKDNIEADEIRLRSEILHCDAELCREVDRILSMPSDSFKGHPVHYILTIDDKTVARKAVEILTAALYKAGRLKGRRICSMEAVMQSCGLPWEEEDHLTLNVDALKAVYESIPGGTVVLSPGHIDFESETINSEVATIDDVARLVSSNKKDCLSILIFPKNDIKSARKLKSALNTIRFVEIGEQLLTTSEAREVLIQRANSDGIENAYSLLAKIPEGEEKNYYISDINSMYDNWTDERLSTEVFPLYSEIKLPERKVEKTIGDAYGKLQSMIGLGNVKRVINEALDFSKFQKMFYDNELSDMKPSRHMVFTGNPGTAKTTVARLFAQIMKDNKVLLRGNLIEVGRKDLVGRYVGWTAKQVEKAFQDARGSVLFIDEAYSLCDDRDGMYGDEAINTIVQMMENQRDDTIVIFAGYPDKMQAFLDKNPGLRSRIAFHVNFDDYSEDELIDILKLIAAENHVGISPEAESKVRSIVECAIDGKDFGNGRFMRNLYERARMRQASRIVSMNSDKVGDAELKTLVADDFIMPDEFRNRIVHKPIGFAS